MGSSIDAATSVDTGTSSAHIFSVANMSDAICWVKGDEVLCRGVNNYGQVGQGTSTYSYSSNTLVSSLSGIVEISGNYLHTCAVDKSDRVWCWGSNWYWETDDINGGSTSNKTQSPNEILFP